MHRYASAFALLLEMDFPGKPQEELLLFPSHLQSTPLPAHTPCSRCISLNWTLLLSFWDVDSEFLKVKWSFPVPVWSPTPALTYPFSLGENERWCVFLCVARSDGGRVLGVLSPRPYFRHESQRALPPVPYVTQTRGPSPETLWTRSTRTYCKKGLRWTSASSGKEFGIDGADLKVLTAVSAWGSVESFLGSGL